MTIEISSPTSTMTTTPGIAGRTNYAKWDKLATTLVQQVEEEAKVEEKEEKAKVRTPAYSEYERGRRIVLLFAR